MMLLLAVVLEMPAEVYRIQYSSTALRWKSAEFVQARPNRPPSSSNCRCTPYARKRNVTPASHANEKLAARLTTHQHLNILRIPYGIVKNHPLRGYRAVQAPSRRELSKNTVNKPGTAHESVRPVMAATVACLQVRMNAEARPRTSARPRKSSLYYCRLAGQIIGPSLVKL
jgi:hypothetical protein